MSEGVFALTQYPRKPTIDTFVGYAPQLEEKR